MNAPRILFFSQAPGVGGGERAVLPLLSRFDDLDVVVAGPEPVAIYARELGLRAIDVEFPRAHRIAHAARMLAGSRRVRNLARDENAQLLYANGTRAIPFALGATIGGGRPLLFHHHGLLLRGAVRTLSRAVDTLADAIVAPSRTAAEPFRPTRKVHVVANGVDVQHFHPDEDRAGRKRALGIPPGAVVVGTLTRPDPTKGMNDFLDMVQRVSKTLPDARFLMAGGPAFPHEHRPFAAAMQRAQEIGPQITATGRVEDPVIAYGAMDVFAHLGEPEGFGLTVLEALACGVPVVAYDWGAIPEVFAGLVDLVPPRNVEAAAVAVARLVGDEVRRADHARRGRDAATRRFGIERTADQLRAVIDAVLAGALVTEQ